MSGAVETAILPGTSVCANKNGTPRPVTIGAASMSPGLLVKPSTGTYGNGVGLCGAQHGTDNDTEGGIEQLEVPSIHPNSTKPYDKTTAWTTGQSAISIKHEIGKEYWLLGSSITVVYGDKLITAASGLIAKAGNFTTTPKSMHTYECTKAVTSGTWTRGVYKGITPIFTA